MRSPNLTSPPNPESAVQNPPPDMFDEPETIGTKGTVFRAVHVRSGNSVHLRRVEQRSAALREARILRRVAGEFVPRLVALVPGERGYWLATEWVDGEPLHLAHALAESWPVELLRMLCHLHRHDVVHGDVKPANILRRRDGRLCLVDFGCALRTGEEPDLKATGGTPGFAAPERLTGWPADPRSDLYSFAQTVRALAPDTLGRHALVGLLGAATPAQRPPTTTDALTRVSGWLGTGRVPEPDLRWAGWSLGTPRAERLARGLQAYLGVDAYVARKLMLTLLEVGGGAWSRTNALWRAWLPTVCADPWQGQAAETWLANLRHLESLGARAARQQLRRLSPAARWLVSHQAQFVSPLDGTRALPPQSGFGRMRESSRFALMPDVEHPLMSELIRADVLRTEPAPSGSGLASPRFATQHLWQAALAELEAPTARALQQEIAAAAQARLEAGAGAAPREQATLAWHLERGGREMEALRWYARAAAQAYAEHDTALGTRIFGEAVRLARGAAPGHSIELLVARIGGEELPAGCGSVFHLVEDYALGLSLAGQGMEAARWARALRRAAPDGPWRARSWRVMAGVQFRRGRFARALRCVERGLSAGVEDPEIVGGLLVHGAQALMSLRRLTECEARLHRAIEVLAEAPPRNRYACHALMLRGLLAMRRARHEQARADWQASLGLAREARAHSIVSSACLNLGILDRVQANEASALQYLERAYQVAEEHDIFRDVLAVLNARAEFALRRHDWAGAQRFDELLLRTALDNDRRPQAAEALRRLARLQVRRGNLRGAETALAQARPLLGSPPPPSGQLQWYLDLFDLALWYRGRLPEERDWQQAQAALQDWEGPREAAEMRLYGALRALTAGEGAREARRQLGREPAEPELVGWYHLAAARIAAAGQDESAMRAGLDSALQSFRAARQGEYEIAFASLQAGLLEADLDARRAARHLDEAILVSRRIASRWVEARAAVARHHLSAAGKAGAPAPRGNPIDPGRLSGRTQ